MYGFPHNRLLSTSRDHGCSNTVYGYSTITTTRSQDLEAQRNIGFDSDCDSESLSMTLVKIFLFLVFTPLILVCLVLYGSYNILRWIYDSTGIFFRVAAIAFFNFLYPLTCNILLIRIHLLVFHSYLCSVLCSIISFWSPFLTSPQAILGLMPFLCHTTKIVGLASIHTHWQACIASSSNDIRCPARREAIGLREPAWFFARSWLDLH